jgi:hypothetical protein
MFTKIPFRIILFAIVCALNLNCKAQDKKTAADKCEAEFKNQLKRKWEQKFFDSGTEHWRMRWFLDGERAIVKNTKDGMIFSGGPIVGDHASHAVLWTKANFTGDVKIEFDFTRLDTINRWVNILYIQATGKGEESYVEDISAWSDLRLIPYMRTYFDNMNLLHVSFAAFNNTDDKPDDYIRARRYPRQPEESFVKTNIMPDYFKTKLFQPGAKYHLTFIKTDKDLFLEVKNPEVRKLFHWPLKEVKPLETGRIGIRHMWTRCSRYKNISISIDNNKL